MVTEQRIRQLSREIEDLHCLYIGSEIGPIKIERRIALEKRIKDYLSVTPHSWKFCFAETSNVLQRSIRNKADFDPVKASNAWDAISTYAANLIAQPWRNEYKQIKLYSGFYKHEVEASLVGAETMLELMGYKHSGDSVMKLEGPVCPDQVSSVSRDALLAFVECQVMREIYRESAETISWVDILTLREQYSLSVDQTVQLICAPNVVNQYNQFNPSASNMNQVYQAVGYPNVNSNYAGVVPYMVGPMGYVPGSNYPTNMNHMSIPAMIPVGQMNQMGQMNPINQMNQMIAPNHGSQMIAPEMYYQRPLPPKSIPTDQLIDVDSSYSNSHNSHDSPKRENPVGTFESWDYVYRTLESQSKDKDDGKDVHDSSGARKKSAPPPALKPKPKSHKVTESINNMRLQDTPSGAASTTQTKSLPREAASNAKRKSDRKGAQTLDVRELKARNTWSCKFCTYFNAASVEICDMCNKSKQMGEPDADVRCRDVSPSNVGGNQCSHCTLINRKEAEKCDACGESLLNSPTYV